MGKALSKQFFKKYQTEYGMPVVCSCTEYFEGYDRPIGCKESLLTHGLTHLLYCWKQKDNLYFAENYPHDPQHPVFISVPKSNVISFSIIGDIQTYQKTTGGGVSVGGAIVGAALMGGPGAILGGRKKTQTQTVTDDKRKTVLVFREDGKQKTLFFDYGLYEILCQFCIEKKDAPLNQPEPVVDDIPAQIKKLADLHDQGILTDEEFNSKKSELLTRI